MWGYVNEADPYVMEMQIAAAADHGVNVFIYDWYWYDRRPFLKNCLEEGFLKASNHDRMKFYVMWANHDANMVWDRRNSQMDTVVWQGAVDETEFHKIGRYWIENYFKLPCYYTIDGKPVVSIYDLANFVNGLGGMEKAKEAIDWLREEAVKAGLPGVHVQIVKWGDLQLNLSGVDGSSLEIPQMEAAAKLSADSYTHYQYVHFANVNREYSEIMKDVEAEWEKLKSAPAPYYPHVSIGWDNNPRFFQYRPDAVKGNTPEAFKEALKLAKAYADANNDVPLITINSWNEWTETSYLEPDSKYGYGYLEAIKEVFKPE